MILIGVLAILDRFGLHINFWGVLWPLILIIIGIGFLFKPKYSHVSDSTVIFDEGKMTANKEKKDYSVVFGNGEFDFRNAEPGKSDQYEVNVVFGKGILKISKDANVRITGSSAFGSIDFPDGRTTAFSERTYVKGENKDQIYIKVSSVFGNLEIIEC